MRLAEITETTLLDNWENLLPTSAGLLVKSSTEEPVALLVSGDKSNGFASNVEIDELVFGQVGSEAAAGRLVLVVIFETDCVGVLDFEVGEGQTAESGRGEEKRGAHCDGYVGVEYMGE